MKFSERVLADDYQLSLNMIETIPALAWEHTVSIIQLTLSAAVVQ
jgi:hypothetical protein